MIVEPQQHAASVPTGCAPLAGPKHRLISHPLCPYVQRAVISLTEKNVCFERIDIDLADKPAWFLEISPLGKTPVLCVDGENIFESAVILDYLEDSQITPLLPADPLERARQRSWVAFGSELLNDIGGLYNAKTDATFHAYVQRLNTKFLKIEAAIGVGPYFMADRFTMVDVVFAPVFRYFDVFDQIGDFGIMDKTSQISRWRHTIGQRPSVQDAVADNYNDLLLAFLKRRGSHLSALIAKH